MHKIDIPKLVASLVLPLAVGAIGAYITGPAISTWYKFLNRPAFAPPDSFFGPIWTVLYLLMGLGLYFVWQKGPERGAKNYAFMAFGAQLVLNILWSEIFFGMRDIGGALLCVAGLWLAISITVVEFGRISRKAAIMMFPYLAWVSFAFFLNYAFWVMNP